MSSHALFRQEIHLAFNASNFVRKARYDRSGSRRKNELELRRACILLFDSLKLKHRDYEKVCKFS